MTACEYIDGIPEHYRRRLGRTIRRIVDASLRYGDGSGEATAAAALDDLADALDREYRGVEQDADELLRGGS